MLKWGTKRHGPNTRVRFDFPISNVRVRVGSGGVKKSIVLHVHFDKLEDEH